MNDSALLEHRFWLQILGDHSRFIYNTLSPKETQLIQFVQYYMESFDHLLELARKCTSHHEMTSINQQAYTLTLEFRKFKLDILRRLILGQVTITLTPTFINHMVNELEEYLRILSDLVVNKPVPQFDAIHHDLLWLPDAAGHAAAIAADLDMIEKRLIQKSQQFEVHFQQLYIKSIELAGYMRTQLSDFPALRRFHMEVDLELRIFTSFLRELEEMEITTEVLDRISPLMPDHMMREECYYLNKLALLGMIPNPSCDPL